MIDDTGRVAAETALDAIASPSAKYRLAAWMEQDAIAMGSTKTRYVVAIWDRETATWDIDGQTIRFGFRVPELQARVHELLELPADEDVRLAVVVMKEGSWFGYCPDLPDISAEAETVDELRSKLSVEIAKAQ